MTDRPPIRRLPPRGHIAGRRRAVAIGAAFACAAVGGGGCRPPQESLAGRLVTSAGSVQRLDDGAKLETLSGSPSGVQQMAAAGDSVVLLTDDNRFFVASPGPAGAAGAAWQHLDVDLRGGGSIAGIDVSPDGRSLAVVQAHQDVDRLDMIVVDLATGQARRRQLEMAANGPPSWLSNDTIALEVIDGDDVGAVISIGVGGGDPAFSLSRGFALASTAAGDAIAVADDATGTIVVRDPGAWWAGTTGDRGIEPPAGLAVQDVAIDGDGSRIAVVYAHPDEERWTISIYRLVDGGWQGASSIELHSEPPPTIDWLE
jgi:DNA-binding beta-propeller fold protein YncE